jgi:cytochrome b involved in lipid metabolism
MTAAAIKASRKFTWQELAELNEWHNVHVAVSGKVYDLTTFIDEHPGGLDQILLAAGRDVTHVFETYHDFSVYKVLEKFYVGDLVSNELPVYLHHGEFARTLKTRVKNQFKELKLNPKDARWTLLRYVSIVLSTAFFWYLQVLDVNKRLVNIL